LVIVDVQECFRKTASRAISLSKKSRPGSHVQGIMIHRQYPVQAIDLGAAVLHTGRSIEYFKHSGDTSLDWKVLKIGKRACFEL